MSISSQPLSFWTLVLGSLFIAFGGMPYVWFTQYIDPSVGGRLAPLEGLSVAILVQKPKVSHVILASFFVSTFPEALRFLDLPASVM